jgi:hypothetical protein
MLELRILNGAQALPLFDLPALMGRKRAAKEVGDQIEALIAFMDNLGGDPDVEEDDDAGTDLDRGEGGSWIEQHRASMVNSDCEDGEDSDPNEDDGEDCCRAGDDNPVSGYAPGYDLSALCGKLYGPPAGCEDDGEPSRPPAFANDESDMTSGFNPYNGWGA